MAKNFMKFLQVFLFVFLLVFLSNCGKKIEYSKLILINSRNNLIKIDVEIADHNQERMKGLMFREHLNENNGMLFVFENEEHQIFWMKNTLIPLDMIFISKDLKIVDIKYAIPCEKYACQLYESSKPAKYVLEVNGNFTTRNDIKIGDKIIQNP